MTRFLQRLVLAVVWLLIVGVVSVGAAGLVATMGSLPGTAARAELTADSDSRASDALDEAQAGLAALTKDVERLGELGRGALTAMVASDFATLDSAVADGQALARQIETKSAQIRERLVTVPGSGPNEALLWSSATTRRRDLALAAVSATGGLEVAWTRLAASSTVATRLTGLLTGHDTTAGEAATQYQARKFTTSLKTLAKAEGMLKDAKTLRDALSATVDVSTLTQWIDRNDEYDKALGRLIHATIEAKGKVTRELQLAFGAERKAHEFLPSNTSGIVIILAEIGRGGLNDAVIGIEQTRARLQAAVDQLAAPESPEGSPEPATSGAP